VKSFTTVKKKSVERTSTSANTIPTIKKLTVNVHIYMTSLILMINPAKDVIVELILLVILTVMGRKFVIVTKVLQKVGEHAIDVIVENMEFVSDLISFSLIVPIYVYANLDMMQSGGDASDVLVVKMEIVCTPHLVTSESAFVMMDTQNGLTNANCVIVVLIQNANLTTMVPKFVIAPKDMKIEKDTV